jgi:hypothetical protein
MWRFRRVSFPFNTLLLVGVSTEAEPSLWRTYESWFQGLMRRVSVRVRCLVFRLTRVQPLVSAVAAIRASGGSMGVPELFRRLWIVR